MRKQTNTHTHIRTLLQSIDNDYVTAHREERRDREGETVGDLEGRQVDRDGGREGGVEGDAEFALAAEAEEDEGAEVHEANARRVLAVLVQEVQHRHDHSAQISVLRCPCQTAKMELPVDETEEKGGGTSMTSRRISANSNKTDLDQVGDKQLVLRDELPQQHQQLLDEPDALRRARQVCPAPRHEPRAIERPTDIGR
jgi:hypothetical protein